MATRRTSGAASLRLPLSFRPVEGSTVADFDRLFSAPGAPSYCWCMVWRRTAAEAKQRDGGARRQQMLQRIETGVPVGLIGYLGSDPAAWVSVAPRDTYRALGGPPAKSGENIWSVVCFFVPRRYRGNRLIQGLIAAAVEYARSNGATTVEAYPVEEDAPSYRFMGFVSLFAAAGFKETGLAGNRRHVMRLDLV